MVKVQTVRYLRNLEKRVDFRSEPVLVDKTEKQEE